MVSENKGLDIAKLARDIAADINKLDKVASEKGGLKDLKSIDLSPLLKGAAARSLRTATDRLKKTAAESSRKNRIATEKVSDQIESSLKERRERVVSGLEKLGKTSIKDDAGAKTILNRVSADADLSNRRISELRADRKIRARKI
ncbi:MAG: hypothetical protein HYX84_05380 [Chloroflexi bacterium]|nr:hypothetical protein [Chloroflexota bacterium]